MFTSPDLDLIKQVKQAGRRAAEEIAAVLDRERRAWDQFISTGI